MMIKRYPLSACWSSVILFLTLIPGKTLPNVPIFGIDKLVHFFIFGVLMFLVLTELLKKQKRDTGNQPWKKIAFVYSISSGMIIECIQYFIPGRSFSVYDIIANTIGVVLGYFTFLLIRKNYYTKV